MVQPTHARNRNDLPIFARFNSPFSTSVLIKPEMGSVRMVIVYVRPDDAPKLAVIDRDHMIQAVPSQTGNPPLRKFVLPRRSKGCAYLSESKSVDSILEFSPVDLVIVANHKTTRQIERTGFDYLLGGPLRSRMLGHVEVKNSSPLKAQDKEHVENAKRRRGHDGEINRKGLVQMIAEIGVLTGILPFRR